MTNSPEDKFEVSVSQRNHLCECFFTDCLSILDKKGADYNPGGNGFSTIEQSADVMGVEVKKVIFGLMNKHFRSIMSFCRDGRSESEHIVGRLYDLANYSAILYAYLKSHDLIPECPRMMSGDDFNYLQTKLNHVRELASHDGPAINVLNHLNEQLKEWWEGGRISDETFTQTEQE